MMAAPPAASWFETRFALLIMRVGPSSFAVIARSVSDEAIHLSCRGEMDCFASLAMTDGEASESCYAANTPKLFAAFQLRQ
jgi:hypothetical protein